MAEGDWNNPWTPRRRAWFRWNVLGAFVGGASFALGCEGASGCSLLGAFVSALLLDLVVLRAAVPRRSVGLTLLASMDRRRIYRMRHDANP